MAAYKFISTFATDKECYIRRLFGNQGKIIDKTGEKLDVKEGDTLYLHRWGGKDEPEQLDGPFIASCDAQKNIDNYAWRHKGKFDWQVRIDWRDRVYSMDVENIEESSGLLEIHQYPQVFNEVEAPFLKGLMKREGTPIINQKG